MATLAYPFEVRDSANTTTDNRKTGLTITVANGKTIAASPATVLASTVTIVEVVGGHYAALYDAETNGDASFPIDCTSALTNPNDRYMTLDLTRDAGRILANLDAAVSSRSTYAGGAVALSASGLDAVTVETGVNARQALALIAAAAAGKASGLDTTTATFYAVGASGTATTRIVATVDVNGNRTATTLTIPS